MTGSSQGKVTLGSDREILAVARNGASAFRLLEIIRLFDDDERLNLRITIGPHSHYDYGVEQLLRSERIRPLSWESALKSTFDLVLSGSANACLSELCGPLVLFPHGAGHHKRPPAADSGDHVFELTAEQLLRDGEVIASRHLLPGRDSMRRLRRDCGPAAESAVIAGDPIAQQLRAHLALRDAYRAELGVRPGQRLVVVSSTWGPGSFAGQCLGLLKRLVAELPADEYRVAATFHHNVTIRDGHRELERRLRSAIDSGLMLIPPRMSWQPAVIAADCVIGDHGSTTFYAADVAPVAIAAHAPDEYPTDSPMRALIDALPHIDEKRPLTSQVEALVARRRSESVEAIIDSSIERDIDAAAAFRSTMYDLMGLSEPPTPAFLPLEKSRPDRVEVTAFLVRPIVSGADGRTVRLTRHPAALAAMEPDGHLLVRTDDPDPRRVQIADALVAVNAEPDLAGLLERFPNCRLAAKPLATGEMAIRTRDGVEHTVRGDAPGDAEVASLAASAYLALESAVPPNAPVRVMCGDRTVTLEFDGSVSG